MNNALLSKIADFMRMHGIGPYRFGILAVRNGRLVERLQKGGRIWPDTEQRVLSFMAVANQASESFSKEVPERNGENASNCPQASEPS